MFCGVLKIYYRLSVVAEKKFPLLGEKAGRKRDLKTEENVDDGKKGF
jgi:hypothetical protein